jgi:hypothetical protein
MTLHRHRPGQRTRHQQMAEQIGHLFRAARCLEQLVEIKPDESPAEFASCRLRGRMAVERVRPLLEDEEGRLWD